MIIAKTVVPDQFWILRDHDRKIGNIEATAGGYAVTMNGQSIKFTNLDALRKDVGVDFETSVTNGRPCDEFQVHGYPTKSRAYNAMFDVRHQLPLWTTEPRSRSWLAAGWYRVQRNGRDWRVVNCPKLILLQRYRYQGPFRSREEAQS